MGIERLRFSILANRGRRLGRYPGVCLKRYVIYFVVGMDSGMEKPLPRKRVWAGEGKEISQTAKRS
jgi:hypothetical protein